MKLPLRDIIESALQAPSGDNCQPWTFKSTPAGVDIYFDPARAAAFLDVESAASWISLGALLTNIEAAAQQHNFEITSQINIPAAPVARVEFKERSASSSPLYDALTHRRTNRKPFRTEPIRPDHLRQAHDLLAGDSSVKLALVEDRDAINHIAAAAAEFDRMLFEHRTIHDDLFRWIRWTPADVERTRDGMPASTLELNAWDKMNIHMLANWTLSTLAVRCGFGPIMTMRARQLYRRSAAFGLLTVAGHTPADFVNGGRAMEKIWLHFTRCGVAFQPVSGLMFLSLRCRFFGAHGLSDAQQRRIRVGADKVAQRLPDFTARTPVMLFRIGYGEPPSGRTLRRAVGDVLTEP